MRGIVIERARIQVDAEATRAYYDAYGKIAGGCGCAYCRNFAAAMKTASARLRTFLDALGLDVRKPCEVMELGPGTGDRRLYEAFYHLVGNLESGDPTRVEIGEAQVGFYEDCDLLPYDFPRPCFQMNVAVELPWLLGEAVPEAPPSKSSFQENDL